MTQDRSLRVRVHADIDKSLTNLLSVLNNKKDYKVSVNVSTVSRDFDKMKRDLDSLSSKSTKARVIVDADSKGLSSVKKEIVDLTGKPLKSSVKVDADPAPLNKVKSALDDVISKTDVVNGKVVSPQVDTSNLNRLTDTLDRLSQGVLSTTADIGMSLGKNIYDNTKGLYDTQKSFVTQMSMMGRSDDWIASSLKDINKYGANSKYQIEELVSLVGSLEGAGVDGAWDLTKSLAGIASLAPNANSALRSVSRQVKQMSADGKVYNKDWNAMREAMGGAVAQMVLAKFAEKGVNNLSEAMANGEITGKQFWEVLQEVGNSDALQAMAQQANTLNSAWDNFTETFYSSLVGTPYEKGVLSPLYDDVVKFLNQMQDSVPLFADFISQIIDQFRGLAKDLLGEFSIKDFVNGLSSTLKPAIGLIRSFGKVIGALTGNGKHLGSFLGTLVSASLAYQGFKKLYGILSLFPGLKMPNILGGLFGGKKGFGSSSVGSAKASLLNTVKNIGTILALAGSIKLMSSAFKDIASVDVSWSKLLTNLGQMGTMVGLATVAIGGVGMALNRVKGLQKDMMTGAVALIGVSATLVIVAKAMELLNGIKFNFTNVSSELLQMGTVLGASLTAMIGIGKLAQKFAPDLITGAVAIVGLTVGLNLFMRAMASLNKIKFDMAGVGSNLTGMVAVVGAFGLLSTVVGAIMSFAGVFTAIGVGAILGLSLALIAFAKEMVMLSKALKELDKAISDLPSVDKIQSSFNKLQDIIVALTGLSFVSGISGAISFIPNLFSSLGNLSSMLNIATLKELIKSIKDLVKEMQSAPDASQVDTAIDNLIKLLGAMNKMSSIGSVMVNFNSGGSSIGTIISSSLQGWANSAKNGELKQLMEIIKNVAEFLKQLEGVEIPNVDTAIEKASKIQEFANKLSLFNSSFSALSVTNPIAGAGGSVLSSAFGSIKAMFSGIEIEEIIDTLNKVANFVKKINALQIDDSMVGSIEKKLTSIKKVMEAIKEGMAGSTSIFDVIHDLVSSWSNGAKNADLTTVIDTLTKVINFVNKLNSMPDINIGTVKTKLESIKKALEEIQNFKLPEIKTLNGDSLKAIEQVTELVNKITNMVNVVNGIPEVDIAGKMEQIKQALTQLNTLAEHEVFTSSDLFTKDLSEVASQISQFVGHISAIGNALQSIQNMADIPDVGTKIEQIKQALKKLSEEGEGGSIMTMLTSFNNAGDIAETAGQVTTLVNNLIQIAQALIRLMEIGDISAETIGTKIEAIKQALQKIVGEGGITTILSQFAEVQTNIETVSMVIDKLIELANKMLSFPEVSVEAFQLKIQNIQQGLDAIKNLTAEGLDVGTITTIISKINELTTALNTFATNAGTAGTSAGNNFAGNFESAMGSRIKDKVQEQYDAINGMDWHGLGASISSKLANGFDVSGIIAKINQIQAAINSIQGKTVDIVINEVTYKSTVKKANGGIIPEYHSSGGTVGQRSFKQFGTDTVPAMLTAGEFVLKRSVTSTLGKEFLQALNNLNLTTALQHLANRTGNSVVNNTTNNITQNVDNKASFLNGLGDIKGVIRA